VERHGGLITIDSQPGNTVLRVRLPLRPPMSTAQRSADPFPT
jgi:nitrogen-specific signal transduction histidine kinase